MVPTDTHDRGGYMGGCSATLTSSSVVDGRPDRPSRGRWRIVPDVCRECSLKSIHCSKVHDSYLSRTPRPDKFTRPSVRTRRGNHPAPSGRPPRGGAKVTWFRYSCEYRRYSRDDPGDLTSLSNSGALVSLVPFDFKSDRQSGSIARSSTAAAWGNYHGRFWCRIPSSATLTVA